MQASKPLAKVVQFLRRLDVSISPDGQLLRSFVDDGNEEAFTQLVRRHGGLVLGVCRRILHHHQDAEDAFQAVFMVLARRASSIAWGDSVAGWLHEVAVRVALEARGRIGRRRGRERNVANLPEKPISPDSSDGGLSGVLDQELSKLPDKYRAPLVLCCLEGCTRDEAAEQLGWTLSQVKSRLERGRGLLRDRLSRRGITLGAVLASALMVNYADAAARVVLLNKTTTGLGISSTALEIATDVLKAMMWTKAKKVGVIVLTVLSASFGLGVLAQQGFSGPERAGTIRNAEQGIVKVAAAPEGKLKPSITLKHGGPARSAAISPDGMLVASCSFDGTFRLWNAETGKEVFRWTVDGSNSAVAFSPDGKRVAGGNAAGELFLWDADTGKEISSRLTRQGNIFSLVFSKDGRLLASANSNGTVSLWNAQTGANVRHVAASQDKGRIWCVAISPDSKSLAASGEEGMMALFDPETGKEIRKLKGHVGHIASVAFSTDSKKLVSADMEDTIRGLPAPEGLQDTIRVWEVESGKELVSIKAPVTHAVAFSADGKKLISADRSGDIHLWNATTGQRITKFEAHQDAALSIQFDRDGRRLVSSAQDGAVSIWDLEKLTPKKQ